MGNIQSNKTKQLLADYTSMVNNTVSNVYNSAVADCTSANNFTLETGGGQYCDFKIINGTINISQTAGSKCQLNSQNINNLSATFQNQLTNDTKNFITQSAKSKQGWFATAFSLQQNDASNVTDVMNQISNSSSANFTNICSSVSDALNNATIQLCGVFDASTFNFSQNAMVTALTSCINQNTIKVWTSNQVLNKLWQDTDQKLASTQSGVSFGWIAFIIIGIVILLIIIGIIYFILSRPSVPMMGPGLGYVTGPTLSVTAGP